MCYESIRHPDCKKCDCQFCDFLDIEPGARLTVANNLLQKFYQTKREYYPKFLFEGENGVQIRKMYVQIP